MKDIGHTKEGNRLVEMSDIEYAQFSMLCMAVEGKGLPVFYNPTRSDYFQEGYNFAGTFEAIRAFYDMRFKINEFQRLVDEIRESLNRV